MVDTLGSNAHGDGVNPDPHPSSPKPEAQIRQRIAAILDELSALPRNEIAQCATLAHERNTLAAQLRALSSNDDITRAWSERAPYRVPDVGKPYVASCGEGGQAI